MECTSTLSTRPSMIAWAAIACVLLLVVVSGPAAAASAKVIRSGPRTNRAVALTFDDGWGDYEEPSITLH